MSNKPAEGGLSITSFYRLDCWMTSYLEYLTRKKSGVHRGGNETVVLRNRALDLLPVIIYNVQL